MKFIVTPRRYDVILDRIWKNKQKATIDCSNKHVNFKHAGEKYIIHDNETIKETSLGSLVNDCKNGCLIFSVLLRNEIDSYSDSVNKNSKVSAVLSEYSDVFHDELPKGLHPKRTDEEFEVELKKGANPIKESSNRMSHTQFAKIKKN